MKVINYIIKDSNGIHARPAGMLIKACTGFDSNINIETQSRSASAKKLFAVMNLCAKQGDAIRVIIEGSDEDSAFDYLSAFLMENL